MQQLFSIYLIIIIYYVTYIESFIIRPEEPIKRVTKDTKLSNFDSNSQNVHQSSKVKRKDSESSIETNDDENDFNQPPHYKFSYKVFDPETGDDKEHKEERDGELVQGEYSLIEPDGSRRIVTYVSNGTEGFNAVIKKLKPEIELKEYSQEKDIIIKDKQTSSPLQKDLESPKKHEMESNQNQKIPINENSNVEINLEKANIQYIPFSQLINEKFSQNSENENLVQKADIYNDETTSWLPGKTKYLITEPTKQNDDEVQQLVAEESQNHEIFKIVPKNSTTKFITYSVIFPQIVHVPINNIKENSSKNLKNNQKITSTRTKNNGTIKNKSPNPIVKRS